MRSEQLLPIAASLVPVMRVVRRPPFGSTSSQVELKAELPHHAEGIFVSMGKAGGGGDESVVSAASGQLVRHRCPSKSANGTIASPCPHTPRQRKAWPPDRRCGSPSVRRQRRRWRSV